MNRSAIEAALKQPMKADIERAFEALAAWPREGSVDDLDPIHAAVIMLRVCNALMGDQADMPAETRQAIDALFPDEAPCGATYQEGAARAKTWLDHWHRGVLAVAARRDRPA